jgi:CelD/BcsL family acetyltransferase involved in cellulose biosynthesis
MGLVMDAIADAIDPVNADYERLFQEQLEMLRPHCHWTSGAWHFRSGATRLWSDIQNTPRDIALLADHLLSEYRTKVVEPRRRLGSPTPRRA